MNTILKMTANKGRGIFAARDFRKGEVVLCNDVIMYQGESYADSPPIRANGKPSINAYAFAWTNGMDAIALGNISFINHSSKPNLRIKRSAKHGTISVVANRDIVSGEEVTICYHPSSGLWFKEKP